MIPLHNSTRKLSLQHHKKGFFETLSISDPQRAKATLVLSQQLGQSNICPNSSIRASVETGEVWDGPVDSDGYIEDS